jgi:uncharacterized protein YbjT (DUF2867 family)
MQSKLKETAMILVTGANGKVGSEAVRLLSASGTPVRAFVRDPTKGDRLRHLGAQVAVGNFDNKASLDDATRGVDTIILVSPAIPAQELAVVSAAVDNQVGHIVKITSKASADSPIARRRGQSEIEAGLAASGIPHTLLRNNAYMQNLLALAPAIRATGGFGMSAANGQVGMIDTRDVAAVATVIAVDPAEHEGKVYWPTGPELVTYDDVANHLSDLLGRTVTFRRTTEDQDRQNMIDAGVPGPNAAMNAQAFALVAAGDAAWQTDDVRDLLGRPATSLHTFLSGHLDAFR